MSKTDFVHLHLHTDYSLLDGAIQIKPLAERVRELGMKACAMTDHGNMFGAVSFYKEMKAADVKPIIGCEVYLAPSSRFEKADVRKGAKPYNHMILLAKDRTGYHNLVRLTSKAFKEGFYRKPRIDRELLAQFGEGIIGLSACLSGVPQAHLKEGNTEAAERAAREFEDILGKGNYFLEIQDHKLEDQRRINGSLIELSKRTGIPLVATNDAHYLTRDDYEAHDVMLCIGTGRTVNDRDRMSFGGPEWYVRSPEEMAAIFTYAPDAVPRTLEVAEMCDLKLPLGENHLPVFPIPPEEGGISVDEYFEKVVRQGYEKRRETVWEPMLSAGTLKHRLDEYQQRVSREIATIRQMGFPSYFLIVWDFIRFAKERNIPVGPGRGSAAGSLIAYCLEITDVDPLQYDLLFERFLNPERVSMPDIDIDFCVNGRAEVINHVTQLYGRDSVCQIITFGTLASKAAIKDVGRALDMPYAEVEKIAKLIPPPIRGRNVSISQALEMVPELRQAVETDPQVKKVIDIAKRLEGCARHSSVHAAGVVISPEPLEELVPVAVSQKQELTTQFEMSDLEKTGMLKMDFLGLTTLTIIDQCCKTIKEMHDREIDWKQIPHDDPKTYEIFAQGRTDAVFQFESCLSGDTQIHREQTIKDLYERVGRLKSEGTFATEGRAALKLRSCYVDEGRFHYNAILDVVATGVRPVYRIITEGNHTIKATAEHNFLTERGWVRLGDLDPQTDGLLFRTGSYYGRRVCADCGAPLKSKVLKVIRCESCAARLHPSSKPGAKLHATSCVSVFNSDRACPSPSVGDTTETQRHRSSRVAFGPAREGRAAYSAAGFRQDLGHYVRSSWEADFARVLRRLGVEYQYEPRRFALSGADGRAMTYSPDFFVPESRCYYEIKGWMDERSAEKTRLFREQYPEETLVVIDKTRFAELQMRYAGLVEWECPKVPPGASFLKIRSVTYEGEEETFDIKMRAPGNNFLANGFVVHNSGMQEICRKLRPKSIEDLSALNALYRPGPLDGGMVDDFIDRYHGRKPVVYITPEMGDILGNTYGVCVTGDTLVFDADTGERVRIDELEGRAGSFHVQGVDEELRPRRARVTRWYSNGPREVLELRLRNGARVRLTPDHQVLTEDGWREVGRLRPGAHIATPRRLSVASEKECDRDRLRVLAYLLADGSLTSVSCTADFVSKDAASIEEYRSCVGRGFDRVATRTLEQARGVTRVMTKGVDKLRYHEPNALVRMLREVGLKSARGGCGSEEKFVPEFVFGLTRESIAFFLASLWDCDGHIGTRLCHYKTISPRLARDVQTLLLRLGIHSVIYESRYYSNGRGRDVSAYQVTVYNLAAFRELIAPHLIAKAMRPSGSSRGETSDAVSRHILLEELALVWHGTGDALTREFGVDGQHLLPKARRRPRINAAAAGKLARHLSLPCTARHLNVRWEEIVEIRPAGVEQVYDITVEGIHNFVGNNIILHNCVYQEQIMQLAQKLGGYSLGEADLMRRAMGKKKREEMAVHEEKFVAGCTKNKIPKKKAKEIFRLMAQFADYGFNRSHSVAYAHVAYQTAYLKANYPEHFYAAVMTYTADDAAKIFKYASELRTQKIRMLPPDVNESRQGFTPVEGAIRYGLSAIKGLGQSAVGAIIEARAERPFTSLFDFAERVSEKGSGKRVLESLVCAGAFDSLMPAGETIHHWRAVLHANVDRALEIGVRRRRERDSGQVDMFGMLRAAEPEEGGDHARLTDAPAWTHRQMLDNEKAAVGFYVSGHPLEDHAEKIGWLNCTPVADLASSGPNARVRVAGIISDFTVRNTKKGDRYAMFRVEDLSGSAVKCVMWPEAFRMKGQEAANDRVVVVTGRCEGAAEGNAQLILDEVSPIENARGAGGRSGAPNRTLVVEFEVDGDHARVCEAVSQALLAHPGDCEVVLDLLLRDLSLKVRARAGGVIRVRPSERLQEDLRAVGAGVRWA